MRPARSCLILGLGGGLLVAATAIPAGQSPAPSSSQPRPVFRTDVNAVLVDFTVVDREGRFVRDLVRDEVQVFEDGREQSVSAFSLVDIPIEPDTAPRFDGRTVDRDTGSNTEGDGRLYLIALDDQNLHPHRAPTAIGLARLFIERNLGPRDRAAVVAMSGRRALALEFTANRQRLLDAVGRLEGRYAGVRPVSSCGVAETTDSCVGAPEVRPDGSELPVRYLEILARWLAGIEGRRKTIVFISEGFTLSDMWYERESRFYQASRGPLDLALPASDDELFADDDSASVFDRLATTDYEASNITKLFEAAARANVTIYTIDPRGNPGMPWAGVEPAPLLSGEDPFSRRRRAEQDALRILAAETGGFTLQRSNSFTGALDRIVRETSSYYVLGYTSDNAKLDGTFRRLRMRVTRTGLRIRARSGYVAARPVASKKVPEGWTADHLTMLNSPAQVSGLGMRLTAAVFRGGSSESSVAVVLEAIGADVRSARPDALPGESFLAVVAAANANGDIKDSYRVWFDPAAHGDRPDGVARTAVAQEVVAHEVVVPEVVAREGVRFVRRLRLKPGRYALRAAAIDGIGGVGMRGSVHFDLDVPDFSRAPLALSGVLLSSQASRRVPTIGDDASSARLGGPATAVRTFGRDDTLTTLTEIYDRERKVAHRVDVRASVRTTGGDVVFESRETFERSRTAGADAMTHSVAIPLRDLPTGDYLLTIEATAALKKPVAASRQVVFSVREGSLP